MTTTASKSRRILIAEDNEGARQILADLCRMMGYEVDEVAHGLAAVEACRAHSYDVILMDCHMPVMGGLDATRTIRREERTRAVIIAVTGDGSRDECLLAGMDDHMTKPVRPAQLRATLTRWIERSGRMTPTHVVVPRTL